MATIEERAEDYARVKECSNWGDYSYTTKEYRQGEFKAYIQGAKEQKAIDDDHLREVKKMLIDKACEVYETKLRELKRILNDKYGAGYIISIGDSMIDFKKTMEE